MKSLVALLAAGMCLFACEKNNPAPPRPSTSPSSTTSGADRPVPSKPADNTVQNKPDRNAGSTTPMDQGENKEAIRITADIRKALTDDSSLSSNAHNCKIMTDAGGRVTLRGVVATQAEKDAVEAKAKSVAGVTSVVNDLEVKTGG